MKNKNIQLPFWHFDEDLMVFNDGSLGSAFRLSGFDISTRSDDGINLFSQTIENLLVNASDGVRFQVFYKLSPDVEERIKKHAAIANGGHGKYVPILEARLAFLKANEENKKYFVPEVYFFVRSEAHKFRKSRPFEKKEMYQKITREEYEKHKSKFLLEVKKTSSFLREAGLSPKAFVKSEWFDLLFEYLNGSRADNLGKPKPRFEQNPLVSSLISQLCLTDYEVGKNSIKIGGQHLRVITLKTLPEGVTEAAMVDQFTKLPFHYWISQNLRILNRAKEVQKLELSRRLAHSMVSGSKNVTDLESESKLGHIEELLRELMEGSERLVSMDFNVIISGKDEEELEEKTDEVLKAFRSMNQAEGVLETLPAMDAFLRAVPGCCEGLRHKKMKSSNAAHLLPLYATWNGNQEEPVCLLPNREGDLFSVAPFLRSLPAWNGIIFGGTGSGKSFTVCQLMLQFAAQRPKILWIDNGASSENLIQVLDGEFIDLNLDSGVQLNVFDLEESESEPSPTKIKLILGVLEVILKDEDKKGLPKREKALLEESIFNTYKETRGRIPILSDLKSILDKHPIAEMRRYGEILYSWTGDRAYGRMLDRHSNVKLNKDLVSIEVKALDNHRELKDIFLLLFMSFIKNEAARDLSRPYLLIIDEAARLFTTTPSARDFAIDCYLTFRKINAGIWCLTQNYRTFLSDRELAEALLPNTTSVIILRQRKIDWDDFKAAFDFNDAEVAVIKSLEILKGKYSEFFFMQDDKKAVLRLVPEPLSYWICTSDGNDKARIQKMSAENPEMLRIEILQRLAREEVA